MLVDISRGTLPWVANFSLSHPYAKLPDPNIQRFRNFFGRWSLRKTVKHFDSASLVEARQWFNILGCISMNQKQVQPYTPHHCFLDLCFS